MKSSDFNKMTARDFIKLPDNELKSLVKSQANVANRRYQNIKSRSDTNKAGVRAVDRSGGRFSVAGKNRGELLVELKRIQNFNKMKTGTVRGAIKSQEKIEKSLTHTTRKQIEKKEAKDIAADLKRQARKEAAAKGKKLSKKKRKQIERQARKEAHKKGLEFTKEVTKELEEMDKSLRAEIDEAQSGLDAISGAESQDTFAKKQDEMYEEMRKKEQAREQKTFMTIGEEIDEENPFI